MTHFACCRDCMHDPVFPTPGHDIACQRPNCVEGKQPFTGAEPNRGKDRCPWGAMHRSELSPGQVADGLTLIACGCGARRMIQRSA